MHILSELPCCGACAAQLPPRDPALRSEAASMPRRCRLGDVALRRAALARAFGPAPPQRQMGVALEPAPLMTDRAAYVGYLEVRAYAACARHRGRTTR